MKKNKVVVLGGSGFIGREIVRRLVNNDVNVVVGCRDARKSRFLEKIEGNSNFSIIPTDVTNRDDVKKVIQQANAVVSLVGILFESGNNTFEAVQGNAPGIIGEEAKKAGVNKLVHISALGADRFSLSKYASSKAVGEEMLLKNFPQATILRPSIVFGKDDNFFNKFSSRLQTSTIFLTAYVPITIISKPSSIFCSIASLLLMPPATSILISMLFLISLRTWLLFPFPKVESKSTTWIVLNPAS